MSDRIASWLKPKKDTPIGFVFVTNVGLTSIKGAPTPDEIIAEYEAKYGSDNVVVTSPAFYDKDRRSYDGRAIHVRESAMYFGGDA